MRTLYLDKLNGGVAGISNAYGAFLAEAAAVCLDAVGHSSGIMLKVEGDLEAVFQVHWTQQIGANERSSWGDLKEATEYAAMGLAVLLLEALTEYDLFHRNEQDDEADFIVHKMHYSEKTFGTPNKVRLEVSGLLLETKTNTVNMRIGTKKKGLGQKTDLGEPVFVAIVEFGTPKAKIESV